MSGRFVVEIPIRWSATDERIALARLRSAQRHIANDMLAEYLHGRADAYHRDPDLRRLRAELREAKRDGRALGKLPAKAPKSVPSVTPRVFEFSNKADRNAAWRALRERHGLIGESKVASLTPAGASQYERTKSLVKAITAKQPSLGSRGLDAATIHHDIVASQRDSRARVRRRENARRRPAESTAIRIAPRSHHVDHRLVERKERRRT